jgi:hypothetical protein
MVDKKDMDTLLPVLDRICTDYRAFVYLLDHYHPEGSEWRRHLADSRKAVANRIRPQFDALHDSLQSDPPNTDFLSLLIETLEGITHLSS